MVNIRGVTSNKHLEPYRRAKTNTIVLARLPACQACGQCRAIVKRSPGTCAMRHRLVGSTSANEQTRIRNIQNFPRSRKKNLQRKSGSGYLPTRLDYLAGVEGGRANVERAAEEETAQQFARTCPCAIRTHSLMRVRILPRRESKKRVGMIPDPLGLSGWGRRIRTLINGTKNRCPALGRYPNVARSSRNSTETPPRLQAFSEKPYSADGMLKPSAMTEMPVQTKQAPSR